MFLEELFSLKGKVALVTGAGQSIGQAAAVAFAKAGADIAVFTRSGAAKTKEMIEAEGRKCLDIRCNVNDEGQISAAVAQVIQEYGKIDILYNNAGYCVTKDAFDITVEEFKGVLDTNLTGVFLVARAVAKTMIDRGIKGSIINMASMSGFIANVPQKQAVYNASKGAVRMLTKSLALEWADYGIRVNSLNPGYIENLYGIEDIPKENLEEWSARIPLGHRFCKYSELVPALIYLACDASGYTTGSDVVVDGGYTCA